MANTRISYFHLAQVPSNNANAVQVMKTCAALTRKGGAVSLYCLNGGRSPEQARAVYDVKTPFPIRFWRIGAVPFLSSTLFRLRAALHILASGDITYTREIGVAYVAALLGRPFAYELHAVPYKPAQRWMAARAMRSPHMLGLVSISRGVEADFLEAFGPVPESRRTISPCAADLPEDQPTPEKSETDPFMVGYVGHLYPGKGAGPILRMAEALPDIEFHLVGKAEDPLLNQDRPANVIVHGPLPHNEAMTRLRRFDAVLAPYQIEAQTLGGVVLSRWFSPLKLFEYMAYAKPIVSSDLPVIREILVDGETAILVAPDNINEWIEAIRRLSSDESLAKRLAGQARSTLEAKYSYDHRADRILAILDR